MTGEPPVDAVSDAFAVLSNETRLDTIRVLGDSGGTGAFGALSFSELRNRVGVDDSGRFSYHLDRLVGRFVERIDQGYRLRVPGIQVYQAIQAGVYADHEDVGPLETDIPCPEACGADCVCRYEEFRFHLECADCEAFRVRYPVDPHAFDDDLPVDLLRAADRRLKRDTFSMELGFCPYCAGPVDIEHRGQRRRLYEPAETGNPVASRRTCRRCHWFIDFRTSVVALIKPAVAGEFAAAGVDTFAVPQWSGAYEWEETVLSEEPLRVQLTMTVEGITRVVTFDGELDVLAVRDPSTEIDNPRGRQP